MDFLRYSYEYLCFLQIEEIELKKDSGYGDAYEQTAKYLDWFKGSSKFKGKKVNGIVCLNNPSPELVKKIHKDDRMKVFEYRISYKEL